LTDRLDAQFAFLNEADRLKSVLRATTLVDGSRLRANILAPRALCAGAGRSGRPGVSIDRVIRMLLIHDLVEIDVGDVPIHSQNGRRMAARHKPPKRKPPTASSAFCPKICATTFALWEEFEAAETPDARFAKSLDRVQPVMANLMSGGGTWTTYNVTFDQLETRVGSRSPKARRGCGMGQSPPLPPVLF
jgi:putative hydrolase of HD superfamily